MPITHSSRATSATISSMAKSSAKKASLGSAESQTPSTASTASTPTPVLPKTASTLRRTRSLRLPLHRSRGQNGDQLYDRLTTSSMSTSMTTSPTESNGVTHTTARSTYEKVSKLEAKIADLENEARETREMVDFLTNERTILLESVKEAEDRLNGERSQWTKERNALENMLNKLNAKYNRNRDVWQQNDVRANQEIAALDTLVDRLMRAFDDLPHSIKSLDSIQHILSILNGHTS